MQQISKLIIAALLFGVIAVFSINLIANTSPDDAVMFTGQEDHDITLAEGINYTSNFRAQMSENQSLGEYFGKRAVREVLNQEGVVGIRFYKGINEKGEQVFVLVGTDKFGNDLYEGRLAEKGMPCPPYCGAESPLNSNDSEVASN